MSDIPPGFESMVESIECSNVRDGFAAYAMGGIMAKCASTTMPASTRKALAVLAYQMADEMLWVRGMLEPRSAKPQHPPAFMG